MLEIKEDTRAGLEFLNKNNSNYFSKGYNFIYSNTNEKIDKYFNFFPIQDKKVLTIASSGDHILESLRYGASEVYAFDKNKFALYMSKLKIQTLSSLNYKEYIKFFNEDFLCEDLYEKARDGLDDETRYFWDKLYIKGDLYDNVRALFLICDDPKDYCLYNGFEEERYKIIQKNRDVNIHYIDSEFFDIDKSLEKGISFGSIFLSNIPDWMTYLERKNRYKKYIEKVLSNYLDEDGMIAVYAGIDGFSPCIDDSFDDFIQADRDNKVYVYKK